MGFNDHYPDMYMQTKKVCPKCGKKYICIETEQVPGFRFPEDETCPYCKTVICTSMEYEFSTFKIFEEMDKEEQETVKEVMGK